MNLKNILYSFLIFAVVLQACNNETKTPGETPAPAESADTAIKKDSASAADNSANALDWAGIYKGVLPCADCEGIETSISISGFSYSIITKYLGKKDAKAVEKKGSFTWNKEGGIITLDGISDAPSQYLVGENMLLQLDMQGKRITGGNAALYQLVKQPAPARAGILATVAAVEDATLSGVYWKLTELMGKAVVNDETGKEIFIQLSSNDNKITGNAGCNHFFGTYETTKNYRIKFSKMGSTMMACPEMETEKMLLQVLEKTDSYIIKENKLQLVKARMSPLAVFDAVAGK